MIVVEDLDHLKITKRLFFGLGWEEIIRHYNIRVGWNLSIWIRTNEIIDMQICNFQLYEIPYDPPSHGKTEPPPPV